MGQNLVKRELTKTQVTLNQGLRQALDFMVERWKVAMRSLTLVILLDYELRRLL